MKQHLKKYRPFLLCGCLLWAGLINGKAYGQTYCTPSYSTACSVGDLISNVTLNGETVNLNNGTACSSGGYGDYTNLNHPDLIQGNGYTVTVGTTYTPGYENVRIWIDYDNDGTFSNSEEIGAALSSYPGGIGAATPFSFTVPPNASTGMRRMRVRLVYYTTAIDPCSSYTYGETEDYTVNILPLAPPNNAGVDSLINPDSAGQFCSGQQMVKVRVSNLGKNVLSSVQVHWSVDGVQQVSQGLTFNPPIDSISAPKHDTVISLGYADFPFQTGVHIKAWTSSPNGVYDTDPTDDTLNMTVAAALQGVTTHIEPDDASVCEGSSLILDAGPQPAGCIFIWSNGAITPQTSISQGGNYSVIVQSAQGCFAYDTVTVAQLPALIGGNFGVVDNGNRHFTFTPAGQQNVTNYFWDFGDGNTLSTSVPVQHHQYAQNGTFAVTLKEGNPCDTAVISRQVYVSVMPNGVNNVANPAASLKIYPNPANDKLIISTLNQMQLQELSVYNVLGAKVFSRALQGNEVQVSVAQLPAGIYQLRIQTDKGLVSRRLEVLR